MKMFPSENFYKLTALIREKENNQISYKQFIVCAHSLKEAIFELIGGLPKDFYNKYEFVMVDNKYNISGHKMPKFSNRIFSVEVWKRYHDKNSYFSNI